jgi:surface protein
MYMAFREARLFNSDVSNWNTFKVTHLDHTFAQAAAFNSGKSYFIMFEFHKTQLICFFLFQLLQDMSNWDVSKVTTLYKTFFLASAFDSSVSRWDTSKVTNLGFAFSKATVFNGGKSIFFYNVLILFTSKKAQLICCFSFSIIIRRVQMEYFQSDQSRTNLRPCCCFQQW